MRGLFTKAHSDSPHLPVFIQGVGGQAGTSAGLHFGVEEAGIQPLCDGCDGPETGLSRFQTLLGSGAVRGSHHAVFISTEDLKPGYYSISGNLRILLTCSLLGRTTVTPNGSLLTSVLN